MVKNLPAMWETCIRSLGQEDLLEKGMATHSRILAWRILWTKEPGRLQSMGSQNQTQLVTNTFTFHDKSPSPFVDSVLFLRTSVCFNHVSSIYSPQSA